MSPEKPASSKEKEVSRPKRRESNKQEFKDLLTFDQVPIKKEDMNKKRNQERGHERHDSQSSEDDNKKRKKDEGKKTYPIQGKTLDGHIFVIQNTKISLRNSSGGVY